MAAARSGVASLVVVESSLLDGGKEDISIETPKVITEARPQLKAMQLSAIPYLDKRVHRINNDWVV